MRPQREVVSNVSINRVNISGNLTRDPELRSTGGGTQVLSFGVAVNDRRRNQQTGEWEDVPNFVDCVVFGARAEPLSRYLSKGSKVAIEGKLRYSSWETKEGQRRSKLELWTRSSSSRPGTRAPHRSRQLPRRSTTRRSSPTRQRRSRPHPRSTPHSRATPHPHLPHRPSPRPLRQTSTTRTFRSSNSKAAPGPPLERQTRHGSAAEKARVSAPAASQVLPVLQGDRGKIKPRRVTGACTQHQHDIAVAIKRARVMALLPYTVPVVSSRGGRNRG